MPDKPELKVVNEQVKAEPNPTSIFDDLESLRKAQKLTVQRKGILVNVEVDKPANNVHFRAHREWALDGALVVRDNEGTRRAFYYVVPLMKMHPKLVLRVQVVTLAAICLWPGNVLQLWPVPTPRGDFKVWKSARRAYELALDQWTQIVWNEEKSDYAIEVAEGIAHEPVWPADKSFNDLLKLGFDGKIIDSEEHPYVRRLRGLAD